MNALRSRLSYANVVATVALVLALGGASAFAATQLGKNSVGAKQLKKNAVTGEKVRNGSLSAVDIAGPVASAERAVTAQVAGGATTAGRAELAKLAEGALHASNADTLGGSPPSAFQPNGSVRRIDWSVSGCGPSGCTTPLLDAHGISLLGFCSKDVEGEVALRANAPAGTTLWQWGRFSSGATLFEEFSVGTGSNLLGFGGSVQSFQGRLILRSATHTLSIDLVMTQNDNGACRVVGTALSI